MARQHGITTNTVERVVLGPGAVYADWGEVGERLLGATRGGNVFEVSRTVRRIEVDGSKGPVKGLSRTIEEFATITANLIEITTANILDALAGSTNTPDATHDVITGGEILDANYLTNVALIAEMKGKVNPVILRLLNALGDGALSFSIPNQTDELVQPVTFTAHYDPADLDTPPYRIHIPLT